MIKRSAKYYLLRGIVIAIIGVTLLISYAITTTLRDSTKNEEDNLRYVSYEILTDNIMPTIKQEETTNQSIIRPYTDETVEIGKTYYDSKAEETNQESSIIYYKGTYIQNTGVDYISKNIFDVIAIADGKVPCGACNP